MATGQEHYAAAERHVSDAEDAPRGSLAESFHLKAAAVHAQLAQAAAAALTGSAACADSGPWLRRELGAWHEAAGTPLVRGTDGEAVSRG